MNSIHPIPSELQRMMTDNSIKLSEISRYLNPGNSGIVFHNYAMKFISKLEKVNIISFNDLENEYNKVINKVSKLPQSMRAHVIGQYNFYTSQLKDVINFWNTLTDDQKSNVNGIYFIETIESNMKLNLKNVYDSLNKNGYVSIPKNSLESDMRVIYDHYTKDPNSIPDNLTELIKEFNPIEFGKTYLSSLLGIDLSIQEEDELVKLIKN